MSRSRCTLLCIHTRFNDGFMVAKIRETSGIVADWVLADPLLSRSVAAAVGQPAYDYPDSVATNGFPYARRHA